MLSPGTGAVWTRSGGASGGVCAMALWVATAHLAGVAGNTNHEGGGGWACPPSLPFLLLLLSPPPSGCRWRLACPLRTPQCVSHVAGEAAAGAMVANAVSAPPSAKGMDRRAAAMRIASCDGTGAVPCCVPHDWGRQGTVEGGMGAWEGCGGVLLMGDGGCGAAGCRCQGPCQCKCRGLLRRTGPVGVVIAWGAVPGGGGLCNLCSLGCRF